MSQNVSQRVPIGRGGLWNCLKRLAPQVGLEPTTLRLTAGCSASRSLILKGIRTVQRHDNRCTFGVLHNLLDNFLPRPDSAIGSNIPARIPPFRSRPGLTFIHNMAMINNTAMIVMMAVPIGK